jgi:hypothetical protein
MMNRMANGERFPQRVVGLGMLLFLMNIVMPSVHAANPSLEGILAPIVSRGNECAVVARGASLKETSEVMFYDHSIRCVRIEVLNDEEVRLVLEVSPECPLGAHGLRLRNPDGISELRTIWVSPFPIEPELESKVPQPIQLSQGTSPVPWSKTISGTLSGDDVDTFQIAAKKGMRISAEAVGVRLGVNLLDTKLVLRDPNGQLVLQVDDTPLLNQDPSFSTIAADDGDYLVEITSVNANADADSPYALHVGTFPRPDGVFPLGGSCDTDLQLTFWQRDQSQGSLIRQPFRFAKKSGNHSMELEVDGQVCPSPFPFRLNEFGPHLSDQSSAIATGALIAPGAWNGCIRERGQVDRHEFQVEASCDLVAEVFATRVGSLLDSVLEILDDRGNVIANGDDFDSQDSRIVFRAEPKTKYQVRIWDKRQKFGVEYGYYLEIAPLRAALTTFLPRRDKLSQLNQTIAIPRGNRSLVFLGVQRERFDAPVELTLQGLPQGVGVQLQSVPSDRFLVPVVVSASESAASNGALVHVRGAATVGDGTIEGGFRQTIDLVNGPADAIFQPITVDRMAVAIANPVPFQIEVQQPNQSLAVDGELTLSFEIDRDKDFHSAVEVVVPLLPDWVECPAKTIVAPDQSSGTIVLRTHQKASPGDWPLVLEANVGLGDAPVEGNIGAAGALVARPTSVNMHRVASSLRTLTIVESPLRGEIEPLSVECDSSVQFECHFAGDDSVPDTLIASIEGLPNRVTVPSVVVQRTDGVAKFTMTLAKDAPLGSFGNVYCRFAGQKDGEQVAFCAARNTKLIVAAKGQSQKDEAGRPLSPLEALRRRTGK